MSGAASGSTLEAWCTTLPRSSCASSRASDCGVLDEVFAGMSDESRFLRYLTPMPSLPAQARRILLALDCCSHVAVAAFADGQAIGLAPARRPR